MLISACMIVKNEEEMLKQTLPDLINSVDEVILVDTGSEDNTAEYGRSLGAKVSSFPWINDFAAARNESIKHAQGEWIIWIDADEYVKPEDMQKLKGILTETRENMFGFPIRECKLGEFSEISSYFRFKVFRNHRGFHFERPINEQVCDKEGRVVYGENLEDISIYHWGNHLSKEWYQKKKMRNIPILEALLKNNPNDINLHYLLAGCYSKIGKVAEAIEEYTRVVELDPRGKLAQECLAKKAWCQYSLKMAQEAYDTARQVLELNDTDVSAYNVIAAVLIAIGDHKKASEVLGFAEKMVEKEVEMKQGSRWQREYMLPFLSGCLFEVQGNNEEALREYQKAAQFDATASVLGKIEGLKWA